MRLTPRERQVVGLLQQGMRNRQIAEALCLSPWTVKRHIARLLRKTGMHSRTQLAVWALTSQASQPEPRTGGT
ncbi:MAG: response regulator transcription factor [Candidatus Dormibacteria bacterium]